ncbi:Uncharacterised protein [Mycobacteroides abscessus subsp. abscessus]|nr:Uncharacterised protein [Mycobacteroides abscessus subsp. abscessus]
MNAGRDFRRGEDQLHGNSGSAGLTDLDQELALTGRRLFRLTFLTPLTGASRR